MADDQVESFLLRFPLRPVGVMAAQFALGALAREVGGSFAAIDDLRLALDEVLQLGAPDAAVQVQLRGRTHEVEVEVRMAGQVDPDLALLQALMDVVSFDQRPDCAQIVMRRRN